MQNKVRLAAYDFLRILCAFLVIVTHTNSLLFKASTPEKGIWWLSVFWFLTSKIAVPIFVMISGACLLKKKDPPKKALWRITRAFIVLVVFSYAYFLYDAWVNYGLIPRAFAFREFAVLLMNSSITGSFWYLYFYLGLMIMLPFLQRLVRCCGLKLLWLFVLCSLLWDGAVPLLSHYVPSIAPTPYLSIPLFSGYLGLFIAGHLIEGAQKKVPKGLCLPSALLCISILAILIRLEYTRTGGVRYWSFIDDQMHPTLLICVASLFVFYFSHSVGQSGSSPVLAELGLCSFSIYLIQDFVIALTQKKLYPLLSGSMPAVPAMLVWEIIVFIVCLGVAYLMRRIPLLKKIL